MQKIKKDSEILNIENIIKQVRLLKNSINIIKDRLYYKSLIDNVKIKEYGIYEKNDCDIYEDELFVGNKQ